MSLLFRTHFQLAKSSLRQNRTRTFLTCLGIAIGVASITLILSLMGSINLLISAQLNRIGNDLIIVRPSSRKSPLDNIVKELTSSNQFNKSNLFLSDLNSLRSLDTIKAVAPLAISTYTLKAEKTVDSGTVLGTTADLQPILDLHLRAGSFLKDTTEPNTLPTAVIGRSLSLQLFGTSEPIGQTFTIFNQKFLIVGILATLDDPINFNHVDFDNTVLVSAHQLQTLDPSLQIQQINLQVKTTDALISTTTAVEQVLQSAKSGDRNFAVLSGESISHPAGSLFTIISSMLTLVASISLIVGGIGVMNIMLVSVAERTHEIGIRKAIGATNLNIFLQFLFESLILCLSGGLLGVALGYLLAFLLSIFTPFTPFLSLPIFFITLITSLIVGTIFGLYPSLKASLKHPIDSLKSYH